MVTGRNLFIGNEIHKGVPFAQASHRFSALDPEDKKEYQERAKLQNRDKKQARKMEVDLKAQEATAEEVCGPWGLGGRMFPLRAEILEEDGFAEPDFVRRESKLWQSCGQRVHNIIDPIQINAHTRKDFCDCRWPRHLCSSAISPAEASRFNKFMRTLRLVVQHERKQELARQPVWRIALENGIPTDTWSVCIQLVHAADHPFSAEFIFYTEVDERDSRGMRRLEMQMEGEEVPRFFSEAELAMQVAEAMSAYSADVCTTTFWTLQVSRPCREEYTGFLALEVQEVGILNIDAILREREALQEAKRALRFATTSPKRRTRTPRCPNKRARTTQASSSREGPTMDEDWENVAGELDALTAW